VYQAASASHGLIVGLVAIDATVVDVPMLDVVVLAGSDRLPKIAHSMINRMMRAMTHPQIPDLPFFSRLMSAMIFTSLRDPRTSLHLRSA
jgi:hypothetical protein